MASTHAPYPQRAVLAATPRWRAARTWWRALAWLGLAACVVAGALVFWLFGSLPFQDLPAHAGLVSLRHHFADWDLARRYFVLDPHLGPYSLFRFLGDRLAGPLGPVGAVRVLATLPLVASVAGLSWARWRLQGDRSPTAGYLAVALSFGFMTLLGFASYLLGVALVVVTLAVWLELLAAVGSGGAPTGRREIAVGCLGLLVLVAHGHAFVLLVVLAIASALATGNRPRRLARLRALAPAGARAAWAVWTTRGSSIPSGSVAGADGAMTLHFQGLGEKLGLLLTPTLLTRTGVDALVAVLLWTVLGAAFVATLRAPAAVQSPHARPLAACVAVLLAAFVLLPHAIGWFGFVDGRLVPLALMLAALTVRREALGPALRACFDRVAPLAAATMVTVALVASALFQREARGWREVLAAVPDGARLLNLPLDPDSAVFSAHPFIHYDKLVLTERPVVVSDVWFHQGSALFPTADNPAVRLPASYRASDLQVIDWPAYRLGDWDYALVRTRPEAPQPDVPPSLELTIHRGGWWLFRIGPPG
jgi:hypothetical protein